MSVMVLKSSRTPSFTTFSSQARSYGTRRERCHGQVVGQAGVIVLTKRLGWRGICWVQYRGVGVDSRSAVESNMCLKVMKY